MSEMRQPILEIVPERPEVHAEAIEVLYDQTFGPGHFAKTAERLREYNHSLPALNRVAMKDGIVIAATRVWPVWVETGGAALFVGPVAVTPRARGSRLGLSVTGECLEAARKSDYLGAILIGAPIYFSEIGFRKVPAGRLIMPGPQDAERIMVADLAGDAGQYSGAVTAADH